MAVGKRRVSKADKWLAALAELSARYGIALAEVWDGARIVNGKSGKELGRSVQYVCGLYTSHRVASYKRKQKNEKPIQRDLQGFVKALEALSEDVGVRLELRSVPVMLVNVDTMEPVARLTSSKSGYAVEKLQSV